MYSYYEVHVIAKLHESWIRERASESVKLNAFCPLSTFMDITTRKLHFWMFKVGELYGLAWHDKIHFLLLHVLHIWTERTVLPAFFLSLRAQLICMIKFYQCGFTWIQSILNATQTMMKYYFLTAKCSPAKNWSWVRFVLTTPWKHNTQFVSKCSRTEGMNDKHCMVLSDTNQQMKTIQVHNEMRDWNNSASFV